MNDLGMILVRVALQGTLVALAAVLLYLWAARRGPVVGGQVVIASLAATVALTVLAFCPLPSWWDWNSERVAHSPDALAAHALPADSPRETPAAAAAIPSTEQGTGLSLSAAWLREAWRRVERSAEPAPERSWQWPGVVAAVFLAGVGLYLLRLLAGLWAVRECRRRARPIDDGALMELAEALRQEMGCPRSVELRELADLTTPATIGWRRPLVLLTSDWRTWSETERRAVLAHEFAHVCRADYAAGLLARLGVALHFYQPLVHWLVGRLQLQQELAADALAARAAGGRTSYLVALSRLALRQTGRPPGWPARAFLSTRGTLMRRIAMLRAKDRSTESSLSRPGRVLLVALLALVALGVSALRSPAQKPGGDQSGAQGNALKESSDRLFTSWVGFLDTGTVSPQETTTEAAPFDLTYLPPEAMGAFGFRPAVLFGRPKMKPYAQEFNALIALGYKELGLKKPFGLPIEEIEQVTGSIRIVTTSPNAKAPKDAPQSALLTDPLMVRTVHDFDWKTALVTALPQLKEEHYAGKSYFHFPRGILPAFPLDTYIFVTDSRTIVLGEEKSVKAMLDGKRGDSAAWLADWKRVERGLFAVALDTRSKKWLHERKQPEEGMEAAEVALVENADSFVLGVDVTANFALQLFAHAANDAGGEKIVKAIDELLTTARKSIKEQALKEPPQGAELRAKQVADELLSQVKVRRDGAAVTVRSQARTGFDDVLEAWFNEIPPIAEKRPH